MTRMGLNRRRRGDWVSLGGDAGRDSICGRVRCDHPFGGIRNGVSLRAAIFCGDRCDQTHYSGAVISIADSGFVICQIRTSKVTSASWRSGA
jgi:hypothetical protein